MKETAPIAIPHASINGVVVSTIFLQPSKRTLKNSTRLCFSIHGEDE